MLKRRSNIILKTLFVIIVINIIPSALYGVFRIPVNTYTSLYAIVYIIQTFMIIFAITQDKTIKIRKKHLLLSASLIAIAISIVIYNLITWGDISIMECVSLAANIINIVILISIASESTIKKSDLLKFYKRLIILGIVSSVINILLNYNQIFNLSSLTNSYSANFSSFFPNRNQYGMFMFICIASLINYNILTKMPKKKFAPCLIIFITMLLLSMSRNSVLGLLSYLTIYTASSRRRTTKKQLLSIIILSIASMALIIGMLQNEKLNNTFNTMFLRTETISSASGRSEVWLNGLLIGSKYNPITGVGRERSIELNNTEYNNNLEYFHSTYIQTYAMFGAVGFIILITYIVKSTLKIKKLTLERNLKSSLLAIMFAFSIMSIFETITRFSIGYADTIGIIYYFTLPLLIITNSNLLTNNDNENHKISPNSSELR